MKKILRKIYGLLKEARQKRNAIKNYKEVLNMPSYFPELKQKSYKQRKKDNLCWAKKYGEVNDFYTLYGLDIVGLSNPEEFIDNRSFMQSRNKINRLGDWWSYVVLLRDKFIFYKYMKSNAIPVPEVFALIIDGILFNTLMEPLPWESMTGKVDYFIKDIDGECASFVKHIANYDEYLSLQGKIQKGFYILQKKIEQHEKMSIINPYSINTLRIVTINKKGEPVVLSSLLRVGTKQSGCVDNWAAGGLAVGIDNSGFLKQYGFYKPIYGTKTVTHPDSGVVFADYKIPFYEEALELACRAHRCFYGIPAIGWDIAISKDGPIIIEGNDNFEISLQQACDRPLKKEWLEICESY